ncbi:MAG: hypothetical protein JXX29_14985 [Deltaproteobacteria bacterium]|nr:hypothetical protein [Deltaproteobacteria bacterium]MBN2672985.1 hypothetical protein [Deltaproteobacteria bacterium]
MKDLKERWKAEQQKQELELQIVEVVDYNEERIKNLEKLLGCGNIADMELEDLVALFTPPRA